MTSSEPAAVATVVAVISVAVTSFTEVASLPILTVAPETKPEPLIFTEVPPTVVPEDGSIEVTVGRAGLTVSVTALLSVDPASLVNTARNSCPDSEVLVGLIDSVCEVDTLLHDKPWSVETFHWIAGGPQCSGVEADALNVAAPGAVTVSLWGCPMIAGFAEHGGASTVSVTALLSVDPASLVNTARNSCPDSEVLVGLIDSVCEVDTLLHDKPWSVETFHWIAGGPQCSGVEADALNVAAPGAVTVSLWGCPMIAGFAEHGGASTVSVTALLSVDPASLVNTARNSCPDSEVLVGLIDSVCEVDTLLHDKPWSVETFHWIA